MDIAPGKTILIIDDEQINLDFFEVMLSRLGFQVILAADGEEGLEKIRENRPDLILLDNIMPRLTGWELTRMLKQDEAFAEFSDIPIIMFSAMGDAKDKVEGFELGIDDYIIKPFNFSEVLARIRAVLRHRELSRQLVNRERQYALAESMNKSLIYFTDHLEEPVKEILGEAENLDVTDIEKVDIFRKKVLKETEETLAVIRGLKDHVAELKTCEDSIEECEVSLQELDARFREHLKQISEKSGNPRS